MRLLLAAAVAVLLLWQGGTLQGAADALRCHGACWAVGGEQ